MTNVSDEEPNNLTNMEASDSDNNNSSFSESLRLFQSIQVLANEEERAAAATEETESNFSIIIYRIKIVFFRSVG